MFKTPRQTQPAYLATFSPNTVERPERLVTMHSFGERMVQYGSILRRHIVFEQLRLTEGPVGWCVAENLVHALVFPDGTVGLHIPLENSQTCRFRCQPEALLTGPQLLFGFFPRRIIFDNGDEIIG